MHTATTPRLLAACLVLAVSAACGGGGSPPPTAPVILVEPADAIAAPGQQTTFTVTVDPGGVPATYRWYWNGVPVTDATGTSLTTRPAEVTDNTSEFTVVVTNSVGSVTSRTARIVVTPAPRSPPAADLRFQGVGAAPFRIPVVSSAVRCGHVVGYDPVAGTPMSMSTSVFELRCGSWWYTATKLPPTVPVTGITYGALIGVDLILGGLDDLARGGGVLTALDVDDAADQYAFTYTGSRNGGFRQVVHAVAVESVATLAAEEGARSRVVTGIAPHAGGALVVSYDWTGDAARVYETSVRNASAASLADVAGSLSAEGYIITALGRDGLGGLFLVGTRAQGDRTPRPMAVWSDHSAPAELLWKGYAIVGYVFDLDSSTWTWVAQQ